MKTQEQAIGFTSGMLFSNGYVAGNTLYVAGQQGPEDHHPHPLKADHVPEHDHGAICGRPSTYGGGLYS